jgi:hypothetical protein
MKAGGILLILVCVSIVTADQWDDYKKQFGKKFKNKNDEDRRFFNFLQTIYY